MTDAAGDGVAGVPGWFVCASGASEPRAGTFVSDVHGEFRLVGLPPGAARFGLGPEGAPWDGEARVELAAAEERLPPFVAPPLGAATVRVVDEASNAVAGAEVTLDDGTSAVTDAEGRCELPALRAGLRRVHAAAAGLGRGNHAWRLAAGERAEVTVRLVRAPRE